MRKILARSLRSLVVIYEIWDGNKNAITCNQSCKNMYKKTFPAQIKGGHPSPRPFPRWVALLDRSAPLYYNTTL